ncbi:MAG: WD40 repeat domain-containing protein [Myxococcales bacterium]|nr:WD40 repeat domain-containing protein [Myxococcales bacterium]
MRRARPSSATAGRGDAPAPRSVRRLVWLGVALAALAGIVVAVVLATRRRGPARELTTLPGAVTRLAFAPDSRLLAAATWHDGSVRLLDPTSGDVVRTLAARPDVHALAFSRDGRYLAAVDDTTPVSVWETASGASVAVPALGKVVGTAAAFAPDADELALGLADGQLVFLDVATGTVRRSARHDTLVRAVAYAPSGLFASGDDRGTVTLWEREPETQRARFAPRLGGVRALAFSPDGAALVVTGDGPMVRVFDTATGAARHTLSGHVDRVEAVGFARGGGTLASASVDGTVRLWDPATGRATVVLAPGTAPLYSLAYAPSGVLLAAGDGSGRIYTWKLDPGR